MAEHIEWTLTDHCCRSCFSRILQSKKPAGGYSYRCSGCGVSGEGHNPKVICACGLKLKTGKDLGIRCIKNDDVTPEAPYEIVARQVASGR